MILPHRQRHRRILIVLSLTIPILFAWGILGRRSVPVVPVEDSTVPVTKEVSR